MRLVIVLLAALLLVGCAYSETGNTREFGPAWPSCQPSEMNPGGSTGDNKPETNVGGNAGS